MLERTTKAEYAFGRGGDWVDGSRISGDPLTHNERSHNLAKVRIVGSNAVFRSKVSGGRIHAGLLYLRSRFSNADLSKSTLESIGLRLSQAAGVPCGSSDW